MYIKFCFNFCEPYLLRVTYKYNKRRYMYMYLEGIIILYIHTSNRIHVHISLLI